MAKPIEATLPSLFYCCDFGFTTKAAYQAHVINCQAHGHRELQTDIAVPAHPGTLNSTAIAGYQANGAFFRSQAACPRTGSFDEWTSLINDDKDKVVIVVDGKAETTVRLPLLWCEICNCGFSTETGLHSHFDRSKEHKREMTRLYESDRLPVNRKRVTSVETMIECRICDKEFRDEKDLLFHCQISVKHRAACFRAGISEMSQITTAVDGKGGTVGKLPSFWCDICKRGFRSEVAQKAHFDTSKSHKREALKLPLEASGLTVEFRENSKFRENSEFRENSILPWCQICQREFHDETELLSHRKNSEMHRQEVLKLQLEQQGTALKTMQQVKDSLRNSGPSYDRGVAVNTTEPLDMSEEYVSIDHANRKYACIVCERNFFGYTGLEAHVKSSWVHKKEVKKRQQAATWVEAPGCGDRNQFPYRFYDDKSVDLKISKNALGKGQDAEPKLWSFIPEADRLSELEALKEKCHSLRELQDFNYLVRPYGPDDYTALQKCKNCSKQRSRVKPEDKCIFHPGKKIPVAIPPRKLYDYNPEHRSQAKPHATPSTPYSCCGAQDRGCVTLDDHVFMPPDPYLVQKYQEYQETPQCLWSDFTGGRIHKAVTLDCEMAGLQTPEGQKNELILLCVADYFTGETIIHDFVRPAGRIIDWRTRYSGVTAADMDDAVKKGTALNGWRAARSKLWDLIDSDTILIGHSLKNDLDILRMIHTKIVDSAILTCHAMGFSKGLQSPLQGLCKQFLGMTIQDHGLEGHICLEDVMATREVIIWCMKNPSALEEWGLVKGEQERRKRDEVEKARKEKLEKQALEKVEKGKRAEEKAPAKTASNKKVTGLVTGPLRGSGGLGGHNLDNTLKERGKARENEALGKRKRLEPAPKANDTDKAEDQGLLSGRSFQNLTLRRGTTDTTPHLLD